MSRPLSTEIAASYSGAALVARPRVPPETMPRPGSTAVCLSRLPCRLVGVTGAARAMRLGCRSMAPHPVATLICIGRVVGALLGYGRRLALPALRCPLSPLAAGTTAAPFQPARRPSLDECANARPRVCAHDFRASYSVARLRAHTPCASLLRGVPALWGLASLAPNQRTPRERLITIGRVSRTRLRCLYG